MIANDSRLLTTVEIQVLELSDHTQITIIHHKNFDIHSLMHERIQLLNINLNTSISCYDKHSLS
ncbi:hypothetical protein D3C73_927130 [compost metagenome]